MVGISEAERVHAAQAVIYALECQAGTDVLPAGLPRFLSAVAKRTGYRFYRLGHGRHREAFDIRHPDPDIDLGLVLKVGNKTSNDIERDYTKKFPEDWAKIYAVFDYGVVSERASVLDSVTDPRIDTPEFQARLEKLRERYIPVVSSDMGYIGDRIVLVGSHIRLL
jgi:hypothetical protein